MRAVPESRIVAANHAPPNADGHFVLYWMIAARRTRSNFALDRTIEWARRLGKPVVVLEALGLTYPWASDRMHRFILDGMRDNARSFAKTPIAYYPYVEPERGEAKDLLETLTEEAALVVTDEFPCFTLPGLVESAARRVDVLLETVDGNGILPLRATDRRVFPTAFAFRRFLQKTLPDHLGDRPSMEPLRRLTGDVIPDAGGSPAVRSILQKVRTRWPEAPTELLQGKRDLSGLAIDHSVSAVSAAGGCDQARKILAAFLGDKLRRYGSGGNDLEDPATSGLSPYLHFGHVSAHDVFAGVARAERWEPESLSTSTAGKRAGWWGMSPDAEAFLDQLITWRELGFNMSFLRKNYAEYDSLPPWALDTLGEHEGDERPYLYHLEEFEEARTHDALWNAAQSQLRREGVIHNYLRMLWGKKILEWTPTPRRAAEVMIELNNKYALDGRDPNSYSGIFWVLGRYDRAWGPERPVYGKIRYMSSENTARKLRTKPYLDRYGS